MKNILLIEPDKELAKLIVNYLSDDNHKIHIVDTSQKAIDLADSLKPDLVILELAIHDQNGMAFLYEFRSYNEWQDIPVLLHTIVPRPNKVSDQAWRDLGVAEYLYKPKTSLQKLKMTSLGLI